jgi:hypothetical protein
MAAAEGERPRGQDDHEHDHRRVAAPVQRAAADGEQQHDPERHVVEVAQHERVARARRSA